MCDYSLMSYMNRLATAGEELVAYRFPSGSMGLASPLDVQREQEEQASERISLWTAVTNFLNPVETCSVPAVCIPPSARLLLHGINPHFQSRYKVGPDEEVTFEQITAVTNAYRDAVRFRNGCRVRLQELPEGQPVKVLDLAGSEEPEEALSSNAVSGLGPFAF